MDKWADNTLSYIDPATQANVDGALPFEDIETLGKWAPEFDEDGKAYEPKIFYYVT